MKKAVISILSIVIIAIFLGFSSGTDMPGPDAQKLWDYITQESPYTDWGFWKDHAGMQPGNAPHGPFHKVFVNDILLAATAVPVPYGSIEVKESYGKDKKLAAITVMYKVKDYNPAAGDWYWAKYSPAGKAGPSGKVQGCIGCHAVKADNDYITIHSIK